jgi:probable rRNA maturation factor
LSFQDEIIPGCPKESLGELVDCPEVIAQEADIEKKPLLHHWAHIIIHGTLHLLGYTHETDSQASLMEEIEKTVLSAF